MRTPLFLLMAALCAVPVLAAKRSAIQHAEIQTVRQDGSFLITGDKAAVLEGLVFPQPERAAPWIHRFAGHEVGYRDLGEDRYGRKRLIVDVTIDEAMQEAAVRDGVALAYSSETLPEIKRWMAEEKEARAEKRGIWKEPEFLISPEQAANDIGKFRLVEGKVMRIYVSREATYLNFGEDWKTDFSVTIPKRLLTQFGELKKLEGKMVRVRGTLYNENGPMLELTQPEQFELLSQSQ